MAPVISSPGGMLLILIKSNGVILYLFTSSITYLQQCKLARLQLFIQHENDFYSHKPFPTKINFILSIRKMTAFSNKSQWKLCEAYEITSIHFYLSSHALMSPLATIRGLHTLSDTPFRRRTETGGGESKSRSIYTPHIKCYKYWNKCII